MKRGWVKVGPSRGSAYLETLRGLYHHLTPCLLGAGRDGRFDSDSENPNYTLVAYSLEGGMYTILLLLSLSVLRIHFLIDRN